MSETSNKVERMCVPLIRMEDSRIHEGVAMIESIWYGVGVQIVTMAIRHYNLNEDQAKALKEAYLKPNDYSVRIKS